mgnify:CR=1 FL=1
MKPGWRFLIFWIFLLFFWEFYCSGQVETVQNLKFFLSLLLACPDLFQLEMKPGQCFLNVFNFFAFFFFLEFSSSDQVKTVPNEKIVFSLVRLVSTRFGLKWSQDFFFKFFEFFFGILKLGSGKNGFERRKKFLPFSASPDPSQLEMEPGWCF